MLDRPPRSVDQIHRQAFGRWKSVLMQLGVDPKFLRDNRSEQHCPCPMCGGKDRFRYTDFRNRGDWWCNSCGNGDGLDLLMGVKRLNLVEAIKLVETVIPTARVVARRESEATPEQQRMKMSELWGQALALDGNDIASRYLINRFVIPPERPGALRWVKSHPYWQDGAIVGYYPIMIAKYCAPDGRSAILHRTFLAEPGAKANVPAPRRMMPGSVPMGGAVRLFPAAETMGVAEGIETALAAARIHSLPVWAALSSGSLMKFEPPVECKYLLIFMDRDLSFDGGMAANTLANRLVKRKAQVLCELRPPFEGDENPWAARKLDWADVCAATYAAHKMAAE